MTEKDGKPEVEDFNFPNMIEKKMRRTLREKKIEEKSGPFEEAEGEPHELDAPRN